MMELAKKDMFPIGVPVIAEAIIDQKSGWEFDAPLEVMSPFRLFSAVGSISHDAVERVLEDLIIDLDCGIEHAASLDNDESEAELRELFSKIRSGRLRNRFAYFRTSVVVNKWSPDGAEDSDLDFSILQA